MRLLVSVLLGFGCHTASQAYRTGYDDGLADVKASLEEGSMIRPRSQLAR